MREGAGDRLAQGGGMDGADRGEEVVAVENLGRRGERLGERDVDAERVAVGSAREAALCPEAQTFVGEALRLAVG
jgi:hypothetical protein